MVDWLTVTVDDEELGISQFDTDDERVEQITTLCSQFDLNPAEVIVMLALDTLREKFNSLIHTEGEILTVDQVVIRSVSTAGNYHVQKRVQFMKLQSNDPERLESVA